jgi:uncharacterized protein YgbK (DUF1537 family)
MKIGVVADDFTGAGDIANTLARAGARTTLHLGLPTALPPDDDAAVVALKSRSIPAAEAVGQSLAAARALRDAGARQIVFKYCSTFDSTPEGNIGPVAAALLDLLGGPVALVCPAFPANGRTLYQGHLFVGDRLLSESGMERHPLTPMTDPDLRRWLARQTDLPVGHLPLASLRAGRGAEALAAAAARGERLIVADAVADADLLALGALAAEHALVTGGSGIALGLPANFGIGTAASAAPFPATSGDALVLAGSCSSATRAQIDAYAVGHPALKLALTPGLDDAVETARAAAFVLAHRADAPLVYASADPAELARNQAEHGIEPTARYFESVLTALARQAVAAGFRRIVVAGGETSGAVAGGLDTGPLGIGPEIATGVPAMLTAGPDRPLALALKSGNFGGPDFFARATALLAEGRP